MNLCGGTNGVLENEFVIPIPDEEYHLSSRRKKSSSTGRSSRSSRTAPSNQSAKSKSVTLNPVSRHDYEQLRSRQRSHPSRGMKSSSILLKKLETGFNLTWINGKRNTQRVHLSTNSDKSYIRVHMRSRDEEERENDGMRMNQRDLKLKVRHIVRVGSEKQSIHEESRDDYDTTSQNKHFVIKMKNSVNHDESKFLFVAESLAVRDTVILAIRTLIDQSKHVHGSHPIKHQSSDYRHRSDDVNEKAFRALKISEQPRESVRNYDARETSLLEGRDDTAFNRAEDSDREVFFDTYEREREPASLKPTRNRSFGKSEKTELGGRSRSLSKSRQHYGSMKVRSNIEKEERSKSRSRSRSPRLLERRRSDRSSMLRKGSVREEESMLYDSITCNPALSNLDNEEMSSLGANCSGKAIDMADFAAGCTAQTTGPWCTDDICAASLKDFADSMAGIFELKHNYKRDGLSENDMKQRAIAEEYISGFLSNNANVGELLSVRDLWSVAAKKRAAGKELEKRRIHNRARNPDGKALRFQTLKKQMTFNGAYDEDNMCLQTIHSYDEVTGSKKEDSNDEDLLYYDSDPEDARERTHKKGPRTAMAQFEEESCKRNGKRREALDILDNSRFGLGHRWKRLGHEVITDIIEATKNERLTLLWHPTQNAENSNMPPVCVKVWVESGIYLADGNFLLPKLTWLPAHEGKLDSRVLNVSDSSPGSLELLDVCRVRECESIDRTLHPFAHADRSFVIQTQNGNYLFETQSNQERGRVVNGLKLVIARLASLLMLRDLRAVDEFFGGNAVPGEAPVWARNNERSESPPEFHPR